MPAKNALKEYEENAYYHIYNRGVEKRIVFQDVQDYGVFLSYLKFYLSPPNLQGNIQGLSLKVAPSRQLKNHQDKIKLLAFCLMPNHYHLLIQQNDADAINYFMRSLATKYSMYFNKKYKRVGSLFQGRYKAVKVESEEQLLYLTKYIHLNPCDLRTDTGIILAKYPYSSLNLYLNSKSYPWIDPTPILDFFSKTNPKLSYQNFIAEVFEEEEKILSDIALDVNL